MNPLIQLKTTSLLLITLALLCFGLLPIVQAVNPPPDGGYPGDNTAEGQNALFSLTTGFGNTAVGFHSLGSNTTGSYNTAIGTVALKSHATGDQNTAIGCYALEFDRVGKNNTAVGALALDNNIGSFNTAIGDRAMAGVPTLSSGNFNTATGFQALFVNESGTLNTAIGYRSLENNRVGTNNTAIGAGALFSNNGYYNTATGTQALLNNVNGSYNTADGYLALEQNSSGHHNTAIGVLALFQNGSNDNTATGYEALKENTTGDHNTAIGTAALQKNAAGQFNTATGAYALLNNQSTAGFNTADGTGALLSNTSGSNNIAVGVLAGFLLTTGDNNVDIGNYGVAGEANTLRIGTEGTQTATYIAGIVGTTLDNGVPVVVDTSTGQLGVLPSSQRFKADIRPLDKASEAILALKPVTFCYTSSNGATPQFGLVAEEVALVNPDLVVRDHDGQPYSVRYDAVNAMLLNEFLKEHREVQELKKQVAVLTAGFQKVSAQIELSKSVPKTVLNNQ